MNDALFDSYMLENFPGRTLDELDSMDSLRFFRAMGARNISMVENVREQQMLGTKKGNEIPSATYKKILEHDKIFRDFEEFLLNGKLYDTTNSSGQESS